MYVGQPKTFSEGRGLSDLDKQTDSSEETERILINLSPRAEREAEWVPETSPKAPRARQHVEQDHLNLSPRTW